MSEHPLLRAMSENEDYQRAFDRYHGRKARRDRKAWKRYDRQYQESYEADVELARFRGEQA